jgi:hypothetical protein
MYHYNLSSIIKVNIENNKSSFSAKDFLLKMERSYFQSIIPEEGRQHVLGSISTFLDSVVVKALCYKQEGCGFDTR